MLDANAATVDSSSRTSTAIATSPCGWYRSTNDVIAAASSRLDGDDVVVNSSQTGLPASAARSMRPPPSCGRSSAGAADPMWKALPGSPLATSPGPGVETTPAEPPVDPPPDVSEAGFDTEADGDADTGADGPIEGVGLAGGTTSGPMAATTIATTTIVTKPAT